jgi:hypothetical protein
MLVEHNGKQYERVPELHRDSCVGCALEDENCTTTVTTECVVTNTILKEVRSIKEVQPMNIKIEIEVPPLLQLIGINYAPTGEYRVPKENEVYLSDGNKLCIAFVEPRASYPIYAPIRWRAEKGGVYWCISSVASLSVNKSLEDGDHIDNSRYEQGNYFHAEAEAKEKLKLILDLLK